MNKKTAVVIGATGLVGEQLVQQLLEDDRYGTVKVFHRRTTGISHPKLVETVIDFDSAEKWKHLITGDELYSALGTTLKAAGSKEAQYKVDYEYQFQVAKFARENDVPKYALVSSIGADASSANFYTRIKGELDNAVQNLGFIKTVIVRPSLLLGDRKEQRFGELLSEPILKIVTKLPGLKKYAPIHVSKVARAMINALNSNIEQSIFEGLEVHQLAESA